MRFRGQHLFVSGFGGLETNESLGLVLRSQVGALVGRRLVNTNRAQMAIGGGLGVNNEQGVDTGSTQNLEGILTFRTLYYAYDSPKTNFDFAIQYFPSLSNWGRQRAQIDLSIKREIFKNFFVGLNGFDTFDSQPPNRRGSQRRRRQRLNRLVVRTLTSRHPRRSQRCTVA